MRDALIIPPYGFITGDESLSGGRGTKARVAVAQQLVRDGLVSRKCMMHFPQKMQPKGRDLELLGPVPLGKNVADYVRALPEFADAHVSDRTEFFPDARHGTEGTFDDTIASLNEIYFDLQEAEETDGIPEEPVHVHFVSDWSQLGRLWLIYHLAYGRHAKKFCWKASFHLVPNFRTMRDVWTHEPPAYLKCLLLCFHWRFFVV